MLKRYVKQNITVLLRSMLVIDATISTLCLLHFLKRGVLGVGSSYFYGKFFNGFTPNLYKL